MQYENCTIFFLLTGGRKRSIWSMTREQINYYMTQFFCLQSDPNGVIPGTEAKEFFERSKLPINDLRKIWQLSDVSQVCTYSSKKLKIQHLIIIHTYNDFLGRMFKFRRISNSNASSSSQKEQHRRPRHPSTYPQTSLLTPKAVKGQPKNCLETVCP